MEGLRPILALVLTAIALAVAVASIVLAVIEVGSTQLYVILLGAGLLALTVASIMRPSEAV